MRLDWEKNRSTFRATDKLRKSKIIGRAIFNSTVKDIFLYASESLTITHRTIDRLQVFVNKCLHSDYVFLRVTNTLTILLITYLQRILDIN